MIIPRIFHRIWLGPDPLPETFISYADTWSTHHPGWETRWWSEENLFSLTNQREFDRGETWAAKANVLRYEIIERFGGVYLDTDFECLKSIEPLLGDVEAFTARMWGGQINNAIFGAVPGHCLTKDLVRLLPGHDFANQQHSASYRNGLDFFHKVVTCCSSRVRVFDHSQFYPYDSSEKHFLRKPFDYAANANAFAVHHWEFSWKSP